MPAALLMSACATALAGTVQSGLPPGPTLAQVHRMLLPSVGRGQNAAVCLAYLDGPKVRIANAGAVAPVVVSQSRARFVEVGGLPLGTPLSGLAPYAEVELTLELGDMVILSSDGIVEAMSEAGEMFGFERFLDAVQRGPTAPLRRGGRVRRRVGAARRHGDRGGEVSRLSRAQEEM
jgi:serine phosphatase RsbU (regulator of sigma subunit)